VKRYAVIVLVSAAVSCLFPASAFCAPYLGKEFEFHQPDGSPVAVKVWGDEFYIRAETLDGYSLVRDPVSGFICYANIKNDGSDFVSTGIPYTGKTVEKMKSSRLWSSAQGYGVVKGLRLKRQAVIEKADKNRNLLRRDRHGRILPSPGQAAFSAASAPAGSPAPLLGNVVGLTLLIRFPDVPATISQADINNYCNQVGYTGYGNNGSVRDYFYDVSNGNLTYTNHVTAYYTALHNRSYYTDPNIGIGTRARELINEALLWLDDPSGQNFDFRAISTDSGNYMLAINAFYAGEIQNNWAEGLWPHMSSMYGTFTSNEGVKSDVYQITNIGSSLALGTFCHENGHMICGYPDLYDYGYESYGAGNYCLMAYGGSDFNPIPPNPYLRDIKGWESVTVLPHQTGVQYSIQSNSNASYKYSNPGNSNEFFYIDSRTKTGRNSSLPDDGLVIWHIDENGSNNNEEMTAALHYMVSVEQADGQFHLETKNNAGGGGDLFHSGYKDIFNDTTSPDTRWWNGNNSNMVIRQISAVGPTMSFVYDDATVPRPPVANPCSAITPMNGSVSIELAATDEGLPNPPGKLTYIVTSLPSNGHLVDAGNGIISSVPYSLVSFGNEVIYTPDDSFVGSDGFHFKVNDGGTPPEGGDSGVAAVSVSVIYAIYAANMDTDPGWTLEGQWQWGTPAGGGGEHGNPDPVAGYTGAKVIGYNLAGDYANSITSTLWAKTPAMNCTGRTGVTLTFYRWLNVELPLYDRAYIQVSNNGSTWSTVWQNTTVITDSSWSLQTVDISAVADNQATVYVRWGIGPTDSSWRYSGWNIDDVMVMGASDSVAPTPNPMTFASAPAAVGLYAITMTASTATDVSGVEYFFQNTTDMNHSSGWQDGAVWTDTGLASNTTYSYVVAARDKSVTRNQTAWSAPSSATTQRYLCTGPIASDLNNDCQVDFLDYAMMAWVWAMPLPLTNDIAVNGTFDTDVVPGWASINLPSATGSWSSGLDDGYGNPPDAAYMICELPLGTVDGYFFYQILPVTPGERYRLSGEWMGDLVNSGAPDPLTMSNWTNVTVTFEPGTDPATWRWTDPDAVMYRKVWGVGSLNTDTSGTWNWESIGLSRTNGPADDVYVATDNYMVVAFSMGGVEGNSLPWVDIDNIKVEGPGCPSIDLDGDCSLDMKDIAVFVEQWLACNRDPAGECWQ
jgi:M6 family metalloprotease-like protein